MDRNALRTTIMIVQLMIPIAGCALGSRAMPDKHGSARDGGDFSPPSIAAVNQNSSGGAGSGGSNYSNYQTGNPNAAVGPGLTPLGDYADGGTTYPQLPAGSTAATSPGFDPSSLLSGATSALSGLTALASLAQAFQAAQEAGAATGAGSGSQGGGGQSSGGGGQSSGGGGQSTGGGTKGTNTLCR